MNGRKLFAMVLALVLLLALAGCGAAGGTSESAAANDAVMDAAAPTRGRRCGSRS